MNDPNPTGPRRDATCRMSTTPASETTWTPASANWGNAAPSAMIVGRPGMGQSAGRIIATSKTAALHAVRQEYARASQVVTVVGDVMGDYASLASLLGGEPVTLHDGTAGQVNPLNPGTRGASSEPIATRWFLDETAHVAPLPQAALFRALQATGTSDSSGITGEDFSDSTRITSTVGDRS